VQPCGRGGGLGSPQVVAECGELRGHGVESARITGRRRHGVPDEQRDEQPVAAGGDLRELGCYVADDVRRRAEPDHVVQHPFPQKLRSDLGQPCGLLALCTHSRAVSTACGQALRSLTGTSFPPQRRERVATRAAAGHRRADHNQAFLATGLPER
jgi:hypothetical protein